MVLMERGGTGAAADCSDCEVSLSQQPCLHTSGWMDEGLQREASAGA